MELLHVYIRNNLTCTKIPYRCNFNNLEITVMVLTQPIANIRIIGIYRSKTKVTISQLIDALTHLHNSVLIEPTIPTVLLGDFNIGSNAGKYRTKGSTTISDKRQRIHSAN